MLKLENLTKRYNTGDLALQGIDLSIPNGQVLALIGPSGAGTVSYTHLTLPTKRIV